MVNCTGAETVLRVESGVWSLYCTRWPEHR